MGAQLGFRAFPFGASVVYGYVFSEAENYVFPSGSRSTTGEVCSDTPAPLLSHVAHAGLPTLKSYLDPIRPSVLGVPFYDLLMLGY